MKSLLKFQNLPYPDRRLLIEALFLLAAIRLGLSFLAFQTFRRCLSNAARKPARFSDPFGAAPDRIAWAVTAGSRYLPGTGSCLVRALAAHLLLVRRNHPSRLLIGAAKDDRGRFRAHAWVESRGRIVIGRSEDLSRYTPLQHFGDIGSERNLRDILSR
jgi:hypothetical protein